MTRKASFNNEPPYFGEAPRDWPAVEAPTPPGTPHVPVGRTKLFDITCVVGSVYEDQDATHDPLTAALITIGENGGTGVFTFGNENLGYFRVDLEHKKTPF